MQGDQGKKQLGGRGALGIAESVKGGSWLLSWDPQRRKCARAIASGPTARQPRPIYPFLPTLTSPGPPAPRNLRAQALSDSEIQLTWQHPEAPSGPISKYIVEIQVAGGSGDPKWMDVDRPEETSTIVRGLNASTRYLFRVRASVQGLGDWSNTVEEATLGNGERMGPAGPLGLKTVLCMRPSTFPPS